MADRAPIVAALEKFAADVAKKLGSITRGAPEDQLRAPFERLLESVGEVTGHAVVAVGETTLRERLGRPDYGVHVKQLLAGYVELKEPGRGANPATFTGHDRDQWRRFSELPNIMYTDGIEWALFRAGDCIRRTTLPVDLRSRDQLRVSSEAAAAIKDLLVDFFDWEPIVPGNAAELAQVLAPLCRALRADVEEASSDPTSPLVQLA